MHYTVKSADTLGKNSKLEFPFATLRNLSLQKKFGAHFNLLISSTKNGDKKK